jgi:hypothetical protein
LDKYKELTTKGKDVYLQALEGISWFSFSKNNKAEIEKRLNETKESINFVFCLYDLWFDTEGFEKPDEYEDLLKQIIEIMNISDCKLDVKSLKDNRVKIEIKTKSNIFKYFVNLNKYAGWFDGNVIDKYINNKVLVVEKTNKRFFLLPCCDQRVQLVYMPIDIYEKAIKIGIIPEEDYFM